MSYFEKLVTSLFRACQWILWSAWLLYYPPCITCNCRKGTTECMNATYRRDVPYNNLNYLYQGMSYVNITQLLIIYIIYIYYNGDTWVNINTKKSTQFCNILVKLKCPPNYIEKVWTKLFYSEIVPRRILGIIYAIKCYNIINRNIGIFNYKIIILIYRYSLNIFLFCLHCLI